jgi:hypothetical protein
MPPKWRMNGPYAFSICSKSIPSMGRKIAVLTTIVPTVAYGQ